MREFLTKKGIAYQLVGLNPNTKKMFWLYIKDEEFINALKEWSYSK